MAPKAPHQAASSERAGWERVCEEIRETEKRYAEFLRILIEDFVPTVREAVSQLDGCNERSVVRTIFGNVEQLYTLSQEFQGALETALSQHTVGGLYRHTAPYFRLYTDYCSSHNDALALLSRLCASSRRFAKVVQDCEETAGRGQTFLSLLVMPIQRVPRHILLLQELAKRLPKNHKDLAACREALQQMEQVASEINETVRQRENAVKVWEVQSAITAGGPDAMLGSSAPGECTASPDCHLTGDGLLDDDESVVSTSAGSNAGDRASQDGGVVLFETHRVFVKEGELVKLCNHHRKTKKRRKFFLFNDCLVYARPSTMSFVGRHRRKWHFRAKCEVVGAQDLPKGSPLADGAAHAFLIVTPDRNLVCVAQDDAEKASWIQALRANAKGPGVSLSDAKSADWTRQAVKPAASTAARTSAGSADIGALAWTFCVAALLLGLYFSTTTSKVLVLLTGGLAYFVSSLFTTPSTARVGPKSKPAAVAA